MSQVLGKYKMNQLQSYAHVHISTIYAKRNDDKFAITGAHSYVYRLHTVHTTCIVKFLYPKLLIIYDCVYEPSLFLVLRNAYGVICNYRLKNIKLIY